MPPLIEIASIVYMVTEGHTPQLQLQIKEADKHHAQLPITVESKQGTARNVQYREILYQFNTVMMMRKEKLTYDMQLKI